jgi:hypothetical protein
MGLISKGKISGWPDYVFLSPEKSIGIEFKAGKNKQSENQKLVQEWFASAGVGYFVCYSATEASLEDVYRFYTTIQ